MDVAVSKFILTQIGDQFCTLVQQEKEAIAIDLSNGKFFVLSLPRKNKKMEKEIKYENVLCFMLSEKFTKLAVFENNSNSCIDQHRFFIYSSFL